MVNTPVPDGLAASAARIGGPDGVLSDAVASAFIVEQLRAHPFDGKSVCVLVPDATRVEPALAKMLGYDPGRLEDTYPGTSVVNHEWWQPETFADLGTIPASRIEELSEGRMSEQVQVLLNKAVVEHDIALVVGPVLPHEVVGISGGNKYFFPGVAGPKIIDVSHWLGALITSAQIIGTTGSPRCGR